MRAKLLGLFVIAIFLTTCSFSREKDTEREFERLVFAAKMAKLEDRLHAIDRYFADLDRRYEEWESRQTLLAERRLGERLDQFSRSLLHEFSGAESRPVPAAYVRRAESARKQAAMVAPIVRFDGEEAAGSGVVVYTRRGAGLETEVFVLTAYHAIRNIIAEGGNPAALKVIVYNHEAGRTCEAKGSLYSHSESQDLAVVRVLLPAAEPVPIKAKFASLGQAIAAPIFTPVYTVGCPMRTDPIATFGEIANKRSIVGNATYWMVTAPAYLGNSGGGVFLAETGELIGLYSKIYTYGRGRPTVVTHMGLVTPMSVIVEFLEKSGLDFIIDKLHSARRSD